MRTPLHFFGLTALGLMVAASLQALSASRVWPVSWPAVHIDYASVTLGLTLGLIMAALSRIPWSDLPRLMAGQLMEMWRSTGILLAAAAILAVLLLR